MTSRGSELNEDIALHDLLVQDIFRRASE